MTTHEADGIIILILMMRQLRLRGVKSDGKQSLNSHPFTDIMKELSSHQWQE